MRKMASIKTIKNIQNIENSDTLALATIDGWGVVVKRDEYQIGDMVVYCEIDSWIPTEIAPFLTKGKTPKEYLGVKGERLKTIRLRGTLSQGLILSTNVLKKDFIQDQDVSEELGITKWEPPPDTNLSGLAKGSFPIEINKTDETRIQNFVDYDELRKYKYIVHEKLEGSSVTIYKKNGEFGVCSRNIDLKETEDNTYWRVARELQIEEKLKDYDNIAIQGELIGPGIQGNIYKLNSFKIYFFNVWNMEQRSYYSTSAQCDFFTNLNLTEVPLVKTNMVLPEDRKDLLTFADDVSQLYKTPREGLVFRAVDAPTYVSFKVVSNEYLLGQK